MDFDCSVCRDRSICVRWRSRLLLHLDYDDVTELLGCLSEVLERPATKLSMGSSDFSIYLAEDGYHYLLCNEHIILRLLEAEAVQLQQSLSIARDQLDQVDSSR
jgi:hypothetical protein